MKVNRVLHCMFVAMSLSSSLAKAEMDVWCKGQINEVGNAGVHYGRTLGLLETARQSKADNVPQLEKELALLKEDLLQQVAQASILCDPAKAFQPERENKSK